MRLRLKHQKLAEILAASSISQNHWALKVGLSRGHWSEIVNGKHPYPSARTRSRILEVLERPLNELFELEAGVSTEADLDFRRAIQDRFIIDSELGQGGMGAVYLARDVRHGRTVAVKVISIESVSGIGLDQFHREIATVAKLQHPNILPLFDSGDAAGHPFYAMPLVRNGSLRTLLQARTRLGITEALPLISGVARALHHAHGERVLHCDIKPENVLVFDDHPYVMDFGIARKLHSEIAEWSFRNELDLSAGTPAYVSPEQASGARDLDARSDVYSLGCMAFEMLAGRAPFEGNNTQAIVARRFIVPPPPLSDFAPDVPPGVQSVLERAMALPREQRQSSAAAFAAELAHAAGGSPRIFAGTALAASRAIGAVTRRITSNPHAVRLGVVTGTFRDVALAWRGVRRAPGFAAIIALTLGLALGANATMFGIVDRLWLRPPPHIVNPDDVFKVRVARWFGTALGPPSNSMSYAGYRDVHDGTTLFSGASVVDQADISLGVGPEARPLKATLVSGEFFTMLGVQPLHGRFFDANDDRLPTGNAVAVISYGAWRRHFGADPSVIGRRVILNGTSFEVVAVAPSGFSGVAMNASDVWVPMTAAAVPILNLGADWASNRGWYSLETFVRKKPGVSEEAASQDLQRAYHAGHASESEFEAKAVTRLAPLIAARDPNNRGNEAKVAAWLMAMAVIVLLIACANVANLVLAHGLARRGEFAVRRALGVTGARLARQLAVESLLMAVLGGIVGIVVARWGGQVVRDLFLPGVALEGGALDGRVLAITAVATAFAAIAAGLLPLLSGVRGDLSAALRGAARGLAGGHRRMLTTLLLAQMTLATALLVGAGWFIRSLNSVQSLDLGFQPEQSLYAMLNVPRGASNDEVHRIYRTTADRVRQLPGVEAAGALIGAPFMGNYAVRVRVPGRDSLPRLPGGGPYHFRTAAGAMEALGLRLVKGRFFTPQDDREDAAPVVITTARTASLLWGNEDPLTKCLIVGDRPCAPVVGVIADLHRQQLREDSFLTVFTPMAQSEDAEIPRAMVIRVSGPPEQSIEPIRKAMLAERPDLPYITIDSYHALINPGARAWRLGATMFTVFGALALIMAAIGIYGVLSYIVRQRTRELGIRAALGAAPSHITAGVLLNGLVTAVAGIALGCGIALAASGRVEPLLFNTSPLDLTVYIAAAVVLLVVSLVATIVPGIRAGRADPMVALRSD